MIMNIKSVILSSILIIFGSMGAWGQDFMKGYNAFKLGDIHTALREWSALATQGDAASQIGLGNLYAGGLGVPRNYHEAIKWYRKAAEQGDSGAQVILGHYYFYGRGVKQDFHQAAAWFQKAAAQGQKEGQERYAFMLKTGRGVSENSQQAAIWYLKAAEQGYIEAQISLGVMYQLGQGVIQDFLYSYMWLNLASAHDKSATFLRDAVARRMNLQQIETAQHLSRECLKREYKNC